MAGSYPDAPWQRMAYDEDGTVVWSIPSNGTGELTETAIHATGYESFPWPPNEMDAATKIDFNNEDNEPVIFDSGPGSPDWMYAMVFPEWRDIYGLFLDACQGPFDELFGGQTIIEVEASTDSTNGITGTWSTIWTGEFGEWPGGPPHNRWTVQNSYRVWIWATAIGGVRSIRWRLQIPKSVVNVLDMVVHRAWHIYGQIAAPFTPDRLLFIDPETGMEFNQPMDWGDIARGTVHDRYFKLFNNSLALTANSTTITFEDLYGGSGAWYTIADWGFGFNDFLTIPTIAPGAYYPPDTLPNDVQSWLIVRLTVADDAGLGPQSARAQALTVSWT